MSSSNHLYSSDVLAAESQILDALKLARSKTRKRQTPGFVKRAADDMLSRDMPSRAPVRLLVELLFDAIDRDTPEEVALAYADAWTEVIRDRYKAKAMEVRDFDTEHLNEEKAEGAADIAEATFRVEKSSQALQRLEIATRRHIAAKQRQLLAARREVAEQRFA